jgi:hypothetical protein
LCRPKILSQFLGPVLFPIIRPWIIWHGASNCILFSAQVDLKHNFWDSMMINKSYTPCRKGVFAKNVLKLFIRQPALPRSMNQTRHLILACMFACAVNPNAPTRFPQILKSLVVARCIGRRWSPTGGRAP